MSARPPEGKGSQSRLLSQAMSPWRGRGLALAMQRDKSLHNFPGLCSHARGVPKALLTLFASASDRGEQGVYCFPRVCHSASVAPFWCVGWIPEISIHFDWGKVTFVHLLPLPTSESPGQASCRKQTASALVDTLSGSVSRDLCIQEAQ